MKLIAEESGGAVLEAAEPRLLAQQFDRHLSRTRPERTAQTMAWDRWWVLLRGVCDLGHGLGPAAAIGIGVKGVRRD